MNKNIMTKCNDYDYTPKHSFKGNKYYKDDNYFGDVIYSDEKMIQVECKNGNKYMQGQIITMQFVTLKNENEKN